MPSREYYLNDNDSVDVKAYLKYMCDVAVLMGANPDTIVAEMRKVLEFETQIANVSVLFCTSTRIDSFIQCFVLWYFFTDF